MPICILKRDAKLLVADGPDNAAVGSNPEINDVAFSGTVTQFAFRTVFENLVTKHFPAPDRRRVAALFGKDFYKKPEVDRKRKLESIDAGSQVRVFCWITFPFLVSSCQLLHQSTAASTWWCGPRPRLGWVEMAVGLPEGSSYPGHSPSFFRYAAP